MNEAMGKIIGMAMAYGVSSLGLLLAYYNYRKRVVKADKVFTARAYGVMAAIVVVVVVAVLVISQLSDKPITTVEGDAYAEKMEPTGEPKSPVAVSEAEPISEVEKKSLAIGIIVPAIIFLFSFWVTFALYKHFTKKIEEGEIDVPHEGPTPPPH